MPELPHVQVFKEFLDATALHQEIDHVRIPERRILEDVSPRTLRRRLLGRHLASSRRHGKWLFAEVRDAGERASGEEGRAGWLVFHFGMTGFLRYFEDPEGAPDHVRLQLDFTNGHHLAYDCQRMFGRVRLTDDVEAFVEERDLGPDARGLAFEELAGRLTARSAGRRGAVKSALMNQRVLAGLGNEWSDEILFQARIHPETPVEALTEDDLRELHRQMERVFDAAIAARCRREDFPDRFLNKHRQEGAPCPGGCGGTIEKLQVAGRSAHLCPRCQRKR
ncbi:MAG: DNA-formamidopyrimidine glycosylase family protein [Thermoanaerobaculia bacterium]